MVYQTFEQSWQIFSNKLIQQIDEAYIRDSKRNTCGGYDRAKLQGETNNG